MIRKRISEYGILKTIVIKTDKKEIEISKTRSSDANILKIDLNLGFFLSLGFVKEDL